MTVPAPVPWTAPMRALLDTRPVTLDELVDVAGPHIPPARAHRHVERLAARRTVGERAPRPMTDATVASGRRDIIRRTLARMTQSGHVHRLADGRYQTTPF